MRHDAKDDGSFNSRRSGHRRHRGIDFAAPLDSPVRAIRSGTVVQVGLHRGLGRFVELERPRQMRTLYAHLNAVRVEVGTRVRQGEMIGTIGKTGNAKHPWIRPHRHLEVLKANQPIDPHMVGLQVMEPAVRLARSDGAVQGNGGRGGVNMDAMANTTTESFDARDDE